MGRPPDGLPRSVRRRRRATIGSEFSGEDGVCGLKRCGHRDSFRRRRTPGGYRMHPRYCAKWARASRWLTSAVSVAVWGGVEDDAETWVAVLESLEFVVGRLERSSFDHRSNSVEQGEPHRLLDVE